MTASLPGTDTRPWFRQFWPWFLIILPGSVVIAAFATLYIANRHSDDLVVDDYYKSGLAINQRLEKLQRAEDLGLTASLLVAENEIRLQLDGPVSAEQLRLTLSHPLEADQDFVMTLGRYAAGGYSAPLPQAVAPNWHWALDAGEDGNWRLQGALSKDQFSDELDR